MPGPPGAAGLAKGKAALWGRASRCRALWGYPEPCWTAASPPPCGLGTPQTEIWIGTERPGEPDHEQPPRPPRPAAGPAGARVRRSTSRAPCVPLTPCCVSPALGSAPECPEGLWGGSSARLRLPHVGGLASPQPDPPSPGRISSRGWKCVEKCSESVWQGTASHPASRRGLGAGGWILLRGGASGLGGKELRGTGWEPAALGACEAFAGLRVRGTGPLRCP